MSLWCNYREKQKDVHIRFWSTYRIILMASLTNMLGICSIHSISILHTVLYTYMLLNVYSVHHLLNSSNVNYASLIVQLYLLISYSLLLYIYIICHCSEILHTSWNELFMNDYCYLTIQINLGCIYWCGSIHKSMKGWPQNLDIYSRVG